MRRQYEALVKKVLSAFSSNSFSNNGNYNYQPEIAWGLPGGSIYGPALVGIAKALNEHGNYPTVGYGKSIGAAVIAAYFGLLEKYVDDPSRFDQYPGGPAQEMYGMLLKRPPLLEFFRLRSLPFKRGVVDPRPIDEFLGDVLEDKTFRHFMHPNGKESRLKVIAHKKGTIEDVTFGDVGINYPIRKAVRASIALAGLIDPLTYDGDTIPGVLPKGYPLVDGGTLRVSPLRHIYERDFDFRVLALLGYHPDMDKVLNGSTTEPSFYQVLTSPKKVIFEKFGVDFEEARVAGSDRERLDVNEDMPALTGRTIEHVMNGDDPELLVVAPNHGHIRFNSSYPTEVLANSGYDEAVKQIQAHEKLHPVVHKTLQFEIGNIRNIRHLVPR